MITEFDTYAAFRRAQANNKGTGFRLPKDWEKHRTTRMTVFNQEALYKMTVHFNTTLSNIDMDKYMKCGFEVYGTKFSYKNFCDQKILNLYMTHDKNRKRRMIASKDEIDATFKFLKREMGVKPRRDGYGQLQSFCKFRDGEVKFIINTYLKGKVDTMTLTYCIYKRYLSLTDDERALTPYVADRYRELVENMQEVKNYIEHKEMELNEYQNKKC
jgi:hypothetical protein